MSITATSKAHYRKIVLKAFEDNPAGITANEIREIYPDAPSASITTRLSELRRDGLIVSTGKTRKNKFGNPCEVWRLA